MSSQLILHPSAVAHDVAQHVYADQTKEIYLGSSQSRTSQSFDWILEIATDASNTYDPVDCPVYRYEFPDSRFYNIESIADTLYTCIEGQTGKGLIHCGEGRSRSPTIILYYLMRKTGVDYTTAYEFVKSKREIIRPNPGFERWLRSYKITQPE
jgi:protein-tyrosine phosphatase